MTPMLFTCIYTVHPLFCNYIFGVGELPKILLSDDQYEISTQEFFRSCVEKENVELRIKFTSVTTVQESKLEG